MKVFNYIKLAVIGLVVLIILRKIISKRAYIERPNDVERQKDVARQNKRLIKALKTSGQKLTHKKEIYEKASQGIKNALKQIAESNILQWNTRKSLIIAISQNIKYVCRNTIDLVYLYDVFGAFAYGDLIQNILSVMLVQEPEIFEDLNAYLSEITQGMEIKNFKRYQN